MNSDLLLKKLLISTFLCGILLEVIAVGLSAADLLQINLLGIAAGVVFSLASEYFYAALAQRMLEIPSHPRKFFSAVLLKTFSVIFLLVTISMHGTEFALAAVLGMSSLIWGALIFALRWPPDAN